MKPITSAEVVAYLKDQGLKPELTPNSLNKINFIDCISSLGQAKAGSLGWLKSNLLDRFDGSVLLASYSFEIPRERSFDVVRVASPKLAFSLIAQNYFSEHLTTEFAQSEADYGRLNISLAKSVKLSPGVVLGSNTALEDGVAVGPNTVIANCKIGRNSSVGANCTIGLPGFGFEKSESGQYHRFPHMGSVVIAEDVEVGSNTCIDRGALGNTVIASGAKIDNLVHIAHNVHLGRNAIVIANAMVAGSVVVEEGAWIAPSASIRNQLRIGPQAIIGFGAVVTKNVEPNATVMGNPARPKMMNKDSI